MKRLIERIIKGDNLDEVYEYVMNNIFTRGPEDISDLEILSYLCEYDNHRFQQKLDSILNGLALFYKDIREFEPSSLEEMIMVDLQATMNSLFSKPYSPVQADILMGVNSNELYSFAAPTSTGKSYVLRDLIKKTPKDVVIVVPSRALINEYYLRLNEEIQDKNVNILTFIDLLNTAHAIKNIFIVTPERCRELFMHKGVFDIGMFLFDEAQLSEESSLRGLLFDSVVRRCRKHYPKSKFIFAHPFVSNPNAQITKNHLDDMLSKSYSYKQRNVGQMFLCMDGGQFFHVGINQGVMGNVKIKCDFDPIDRILRQEGGSVMIYVSKSSILKGDCLQKFEKYVNLCRPTDNIEVKRIIEKLEEYTGGRTDERRFFYSEFIDLLRKGIVFHHGSLPMKSRLLIEDYIRNGHCRICFATSTLEQGINMPFDAVILDKFSSKDSLAIKNLIGRAGRSTKNRIFDYGYVVLKSVGNMSTLRKILQRQEQLNEESSLDKRDNLDEDFRDFKDAVNNETINDAYNLTPRELSNIKAENVHHWINLIIGSLFYDGKLTNKRLLNNEGFAYRTIIDSFVKIYEANLGREVVDAEKYVLEQAIIIMLYKMYGKTFRNICWLRYSYASRLFERRNNQKNGRNIAITANFVVCYKEIPNRYLRNYPLFDKGTKADDVSYDRIIYDTYDYLDKLVNYKLADIYYAASMEYYNQCHEELVKKLALLVRYGTYNEKHIWMLRYGMAFEDIEKLDEHIETIDETGIVFKESIYGLDKEDKMMIERFIN